jgi:GH24 family phage-related lysozyme (muramidase)
MVLNKRILGAIAAATAIAIPAEGLRQYAYYDPPGILTVCYGHTGGVVKNKKYSLDECKHLLDADMLEAVSVVERCNPGLPDPVLAAFSDAVFNIGPKVACNSTAAKYLQNGHFKEACNELPKWNKATVGGKSIELPGLTSRRLKEKELCLSYHSPTNYSP